jgi:hypothetical protein
MKESHTGKWSKIEKEPKSSEKETIDNGGKNGRKKRLQCSMK